VQRLHEPVICVFGNLLGDAECEALIDAARPRLLRSRTIDTQTGNEALNRHRTSHGMFFSRAENPIVQRIEARAARLLRWPSRHFEGLQILRYGQGGEYRPHYDYFDPQEPGTASLLSRGGQRVATLVMYLHEPAGGGATVFPQVGLRVVPRRGSAVFFSYADAHPASLTLHGGEPVTDGEKWIATLWLRERPFR
jgi:prolyl 4-hydroxylase